MPEVDVTHITYTDVGDLELVPSKGFMDLTDMILLIQNDTTRRATLSTLLERLKDTVTVVNGKSAYELAVENGFEGTEKEWLESFGSSDELKAVLGDYVVIDAGWSGNSLVPVDSSATIPTESYIIYRVKQKDGVSYLYYTINSQGTGYDEWFGMIPVVDEMKKVVKSYTPETIYTIDLIDGYLKITGSDPFIFADFPIPTTGDFGHIYNVRNFGIPEDSGKWYFNTYGTLHEYEGVAQYIQTLMSETLPTAKKAVTAEKLATKREVILNNSEGNVIGKTTFDGSADAIINFTPGMINAALLAQKDGKVPINISGTATKLATARTISLSGLVTGSVNFDGSADVKIATKVDTDSIVAGSAKKLNKSVPLKVTGGGSNEGITKTVDGATVYFANVGTQEDGSFIPSSTQVYTWYPSYGTLVNKYDGTTPVDLVLTRVNASVLYGDTPAAIDITGSAASAGSFEVEQRSNSTDMVLVGAANSTDMSNGKTVLYDQNVYVSNMDTSGNRLSAGNPTVVSPQFKGTLIGNSSTATKAANMTTYTKSITSTDISFMICKNLCLQTINNSTSFTVTIPINWAVNAFIDPGDALHRANYILSANAELTIYRSGSTYRISMGSASSGNASSWSAAKSLFILSYNTTYSETDKFFCANKISGGSFNFGLDLDISDYSSTAIMITILIYADCIWANSFSSRTVSVTLSSFGALPMPDPCDLSGIGGHLTNTNALNFYAAEPVSLPLRAKPDTDYGTYRFRNIAFGTSTNPTSESGYDSTWGGNGAIYIRY